jgi:hypothetical protein
MSVELADERAGPRDPRSGSRVNAIRCGVSVRMADHFARLHDQPARYRDRIRKDRGRNNRSDRQRSGGSGEGAGQTSG